MYFKEDKKYAFFIIKKNIKGFVQTIFSFRYKLKILFIRFEIWLNKSDTKQISNVSSFKFLNTFSFI